MRATVANQYLTHPFRTVSERLSEKGKRSLPCSLTEHQNGTFRPIFASQHVQIRAQSVVRTPFRTVSLRRWVNNPVHTFDYLLVTARSNKIHSFAGCGKTHKPLCCVRG